uniref:C2H2-type domain-containing protein n=1 Tax=Salvator merianae TaxID=96440 RepID=A0A8D0DLI5_SALMN
MDLGAGMEVGAEIEVTEDGILEDLPLHLENAKNCFSWETVDFSSSDDDGEAYFSFCLPVRRPPRPIQRLPAQRRPAQRPPASPSLLKPPPCEKWISPLYPFPLHTGVSTPPGFPSFGAHQCQKCLQVFMEEWHYTQHLKDHADEEAQKQAAQLRPRSPPRKLRCLECGKRFLRPEHFARHTKWHLKLVRKGIKVCHRKGSRRSSQASYVYKSLGAAENQSGEKDLSGLPLTQPRSVQEPGLSKAGKRKAVRHPKTMSIEASLEEGFLVSSHPEESVAILDGEVGMTLLQPWQKQEAILEGQVAAGLFQPSAMNTENQIIILDGDEAEAIPVTPGHHYAEVQTTVFDSQGTANSLRPLLVRAEEQAAILDTQINLNSLQLGDAKEQAALASSWVAQNPCTLFRTVLLQTEEQATVVDGHIDPSSLQQVIIKTSEVSPTLYVDPEPHQSSLDSAALHLVPMHQESQIITVPCGNSLTLDQVEPTDSGENAWEAQSSSFQFSSYLPSIYQQNKQSSPTATASLSPKGPMVVRLVPCASSEHPEVLDLEYDTGGGIPVASEPWEASVRATEESYSAEEVAEDSLIVVEVDPDLGDHSVVVDCPRNDRPATGQPAQRAARPTHRVKVWRFKCPDCGVRYSQMSQLRSHRKWLKRRGRTFLCECGTSFRGLLHLLRHQLRHLDEALFICSTCGKSLKGHRGLARHSPCRPGPAHFSCLCGVTFQRLSRYLWHHVRNQRPGLRVYTLSGFLASG